MYNCIYTTYLILDGVHGMNKEKHCGVHACTGSDVLVVHGNIPKLWQIEPEGHCNCKIYFLSIIIMKCYNVNISICQ